MEELSAAGDIAECGSLTNELEGEFARVCEILESEIQSEQAKS
jgi:hypothetical protein